MLKDIRIKTQHGERLTKVIVLAETKEGIVYIPLNAISRIDYDRFTEMYYRTKDKMTLLEAMREERLDNGRNALVVYKDIIRNKTYQTGNKGKTTQYKETIESDHIAIPTNRTEEPEPPEGYEKSEEKPKKRGPGRPPKKKESEQKVKDIEFPDDD